MQKYDIHENGSVSYLRLDFSAIEKDSLYEFAQDIAGLVHAYSPRQITIDATSFPEHGSRSNGDWSITRLDHIVSMMADHPNVYLKVPPQLYQRYRDWFGEQIMYDEARGFSLKPAGDALVH